MSTLAMVSLVVTAAALFGWFSSRVLRMPITIGTMLLTVACSVSLTLLGHRFSGIHSGAVVLVERIKFENLILHGVLGLLLFAGAFLLDLEYLAQEKLAVGLLSVVGTLVAASCTAAVMHTVLPLLTMPVPWLECLFFGALISPTDPIAVLEMLHRVGVAKNIQAQLAGESLFNDGVGAVLFLAVLDASRGATPSVGHVSWLLLVKSCGGLVLGVGLAWLASELMRRVESFQVEVLMTLALALGGYALGEVLRVSSPLEAVAAGLGLRHFNAQHDHAAISHESLDRFWKMADEVQNAILFVLLGMEVLVIPFNRGMFYSGGLAVVTVTLIRAMVVGLVLLLVRWLQPTQGKSFLTLTWGGLRGGLSIALALTVPELHGRAWILATTYIVVVFSIVIQGGTLDWLLRRSSSQGKQPEAA